MKSGEEDMKIGQEELKARHLWLVGEMEYQTKGGWEEMKVGLTQQNKI